MYCPNCGTKSNEAANYCSKCGFKFENNLSQNSLRTSDDDILIEKLGDVGEKSADIFGRDPISYLCVRAGSRAGSCWAAKRLSTESYEMSCDVSAEQDLVCTAVLHVLEKNNAEILKSQKNKDTFEIKAAIGSGFLNMNPAVINVFIKQEGPDKTKILIQASAKEGLIKQNTAEKAVRKIAQQLLG